MLWTATVMHADWKSRENARCSLCACSSGCNTNRQPVRWRRGGCWVKWLEVKTSAKINGKRCVERSEEMDAGIRTAVEGVDPGEPGQATSTEGLHPPFLSLSQSLCFFLFFPSVLFCCCSSSCLFSLSLTNSLHLAERSQKNHLERKKCQKDTPGVQQADKQASRRRSV